MKTIEDLNNSIKKGEIKTNFISSLNYPQSIAINDDYIYISVLYHNSIKFSQKSSCDVSLKARASLSPLYGHG
jgi:hypothetical protein